MNLENIDKLLPLLSLIVAILAVFVGPFISWHVGNQQSKISLKIANKQIIAPMRQAWINDLRAAVTEVLAKSAHYWVNGFKNREATEYLRIEELLYKIELLINPNDDDHAALINQIDIIIKYIVSPTSSVEVFKEAHKKAQTLAQVIFKKEWNRVKADM